MNDDELYRPERIERSLRSAFWIDDLVFHRIDSDPSPGLVTEVIVSDKGVIYTFQWDVDFAARHYENELTDRAPEVREP